MKFPSHILVDVSRSNAANTSQYWSYKYIITSKDASVSIILFENLVFQKTLLLKKENLILNKITKNQKAFTARYNFTNPSLFLTKKKKNFYLSVFGPKLKVKSKLLYSKHFGKEIYDYCKNSTQTFDKKTLKRKIINFKYQGLSQIQSNNKLWNLFDINFLRKEKIYTKLKYSRVPQYDAVSGGSAALLAGFLGFLISEKFGFELPDSGDFYFLFMYFVFLIFFLRLFVKIMAANADSWLPFSPKWFFSFYKTVFILAITALKKIK